jgi:hydrogenase expression/formation protein HypD
MSSPRELLDRIAALPLYREVSLLVLSSSQERIISMADMRHLLPRHIRLRTGPGCPAALCPEADLRQAIRLAERHDLTLLIDENLMRLPVRQGKGGPASLLEAARSGLDVRAVDVPMRALMAAEAEPQRRMVYFASGFETLVAPLASMIIDGLPNNLALQLCARRVEPLVEKLLQGPSHGIDGLVLPGNRCALTGTLGWERLLAPYGLPAVVAGYTANSILHAVHALLERIVDARPGIENCYRPLVSAEGNALAQDQVQRVFAPASGRWRGIGEIADSALVLRRSYDMCNADRLYPDYRDDPHASGTDIPAGCDCPAVMTGRKGPTECGQFAMRCTPTVPLGPCMASEEGACFLHRNSRNAA